MADCQLYIRLDLDDVKTIRGLAQSTGLTKTQVARALIRAGFRRLHHAHDPAVFLIGELKPIQEGDHR